MKKTKPDTTKQTPAGATIQLVDSATGIYAARCLTSFPLFLADKSQAPDNLRELFDPETNPENWIEETEYWLPRLFVEHQPTGQLWRIDWREGDLIAINPAAEWNEEEDCYMLPASKKEGKI